MRKTEYLEKIREILTGVDEDIVKDILEDYENHFEMGMKEGRTEEEIAAELGDPKEMEDEMRQLVQAAGTTGTEEAEEKETIHCARETEKKFQDDSNVKATRLELEVVSADIYVVQSKDNKFNINWENHGGRKAAGMMSFEVEQRGNTVFAREHVKKSGLFGISVISRASSEVYVELPEDFEAVDIRSTSGEIEITRTSILGEYRVTSTSGDIIMRECRALAVEANCTSGDIRCENVDARAIRARSVSGDVVATNIDQQTCEINSVSGDVNVGLTNGCTGFTVNAQSVSGDVVVPKFDSYQKDGKHRVYVFGDGHAKVEAKTVSGDVRIR